MKSKIPQPTIHPTRREFLTLAGSALGVFSILASRKARAAGRARPSNILLVFPDQLRPDWNQLNPRIAVRTPHLARLAVEGMRFTRAYCPSPLCAPSRACLAQGRRYGRTGVASNSDDNPDGVRTFYQELQAAGYQVGSIGKADLRKAAYDWGPDGFHRAGERVYFRDWGFTHGFDSEGKIDVVIGRQKQQAKGNSDPSRQAPYCRMLGERRDGSLETYLHWYSEARDKMKHPMGGYTYTEPCALPDAAYNDNWVGANALGLLEHGFASGQPWFLQVNFPGPHNPLDVTPGMAGWYGDTTFPGPVANTEFTPAVHAQIRRNYSAMVANIDRWLGRLLAALAARGEAEDTLVVFSSDHGEMLGDHNRWAKTLPYEPSASVPLIARGPGIHAGTTHNRPVTTLDLPATFLEFARRPVPAGMDSASMLPLLRGDARAARPHITSALGSWRLACQDRFKLVRGFDPSASSSAENGASAPKSRDEPVLLFDLEADPTERDNLAGRRPEVVARMDGLLPG